MGRRLVVDAMNVVGSRPDGWWRDRPGALRRLVEGLQCVAAATGDEITVVLEGPQLDGLATGSHDGVVVEWATRRGADAGDDRVVEVVGSDPSPETLVVVTADRRLADRVRSAGASVEGPSGLRRLVDRYGVD